MSSLICGGCGHANEVGSRFCEQCGSPLAPRCPSCGAEVSPAAKFCNSCGAPIVEEQQASAALKVVSVVFSDLVGSTTLQETLEPESVRRVMTRFYEAMRTVVERHAGAIQKFIGDAVVAVFGVPSVSEDDALRATRCAAAMTEALAELNDELEQTWGVRLQIRTGVNTGELAISDEGIFVGDTMNTAARLEQAADAGQVLLGETTWRLVRHEIEVEEIDPLEVKGKSAPVRVWRVVSTQPRGPAAAEAPLVGRASELERLRAGLEDAISARACRLVTVIGSAGLGKSRLAHEFAGSLDDQAVVLEGHCEASGEGITFLPVAEVLRAAASIADEDAGEQVIAKLTNAVPQGPDRDRVVARVAGLLGVGAPAPPEETFWGVRTVLESLARERPLVVVLDDVHWGQPMFLDLIEHLVEWVRDAPVLLVALARSELRETREALTHTGRRAVDVIELEPLEPDQSRELLGGLLGRVDLSDELLARILETTEGNPLFLGELMRMLVDDGSLEREGDVWVAGGGADAVQVPPTIQALLTARIERLRADERSVVERAAVIGKQFYRGAVAELVAPPIRSGIDGHLETLRRKDMVEPEGTYWIDEPVYRFHHILIRDAAYHLVLKEARAELHEKFADWLETKAGELVGEHEEVIAYHLEQAHEYRRQLGPVDERGRAIGARAAAMFASAGRRALAREDLAAAANLLQRAQERDPEADVLWDLGEALLSAGETVRAAGVIAHLSGPRGDVLSAQLAVLTGTGSLEETFERVTAGTEALAASGDAAAEAKGHHVTAQVQAQLGRVADVETSLDRALLAARKADDRRRITAVLAAAPRAALWGPSPVVRASGRCLDVVRILRMTPGNRHVEAVALRCQAVLEAMRGRADAAREILESGRATLEELGLTLELHELTMHAGIVELLAGHPDRAEGLVRSARDGFAELGLSVSAAQAASLLARALVEQGRDEDALTESENAERHAGGDLKTTITWLGVRAEALARRGELDLAMELARRAVALAEPTDALADKADASMALARVLRDAGHAEEATRAAESARALYEAKDHAVGVERARELAHATPPGRRPAERVEKIAAIEDPEVAAFLARYAESVAGRDVEAFIELHAPDWVVIDHRQLGWGERGDIRAQIEPALEGSTDLRFDVDEVIACAAGIVAMRSAWRGHSSDGGGEFEVPMAYVSTIRDGRMDRSEVFDPDAEISIRACFEDLRGRMLLGHRAPERSFRRFVDAYARRDREGLADFWSPDTVMVDHRTISWEELHGRESLLDLAESGFRMMPDGRCVVDEVVACEDRVIVCRIRFVGSGSDGGGAIEVAVGLVNVVDHDAVIQAEFFDHDDRDGMLARYRELGGTVDVLGDSPPERWWSEFKRRFDARDLDRLVELYAPDWTLIDHRQIGMDVVRDPRELFSSGFDGSPDLRVDVNEVIACDDRVIATDMSYRGTSSSDAGGGEFELRAVAVSVVEDGLARSSDIFAPEDRIAIMARWRELHGLRLLGDRPSERFFATWVDCYGRRDVDGLAQMVDEDFAFVDRRQMAWEEQHGREQILEVARSGWAMTRVVREVIDEVLACDDHLWAGRVTYVGEAVDGGGEIEFSIGYLFEYSDTGLRRGEQFEHDDTEGMLARYRELGGALEPLLGDRPPERWWADFKRRFDAHDLDRLVELYDEDWTLTDHRQIGMDVVRNPRELFRGAFDGSPDVRVDVNEVIACDERVIAIDGGYRGASSSDTGGGQFELRFVVVSVIEDGVARSTEGFDPADRTAAMARWRELHGLGLLGDLPPERFWAKWVDCYAGKDGDGIVELIDDDYTFVDRRSLGWEEHRGREQFLEVVSSGWNMWEGGRLAIDEVLAVDERTCALRCTYLGLASGGGDAELPVGYVADFTECGFQRVEQFEHEDTEGMLARYRELGGRLPTTPGDLPPERWTAEFTRLWRAGDWNGLLELYAEDSQMIDHRSLPLWEPVMGSEGWRAWFDGVDGLRTDRRDFIVDEQIACDERVWAGRVRWAVTVDGADGELEGGMVGLFENGVAVSLHVYDPDDRQGMIARYAELGGGTGALGDSPPERAAREWVRLYGTRDLDRFAGLISEDFALTDHSRLRWEEIRGRDAWLEITRTAINGLSDLRAEVNEVLASDDHALALVFSWRGTASPEAGGGPFELIVGEVRAFQDGRFTSVDVYDPDDREAMLTRFAELTRSGQPELGDRTAERFMAEVQRVLNAREYDRLAELVADDWYFVDHRALGWQEAHGRDECVAVMHSFFDASPDVRFDFDELLAADDRLVVLRVAIRGHGLKAGEHETVTGAVYLVEDGRWAGADFYEPDDRAAMIARYAALGGGTGPLGDRPPERVSRAWVRAYGMRDLDGLRALFADDWVLVDHRGLGWDELRGRDAFIEGTRAAFDASADVRAEIEDVLACDNRVIAVIFSWRGTALPKAGGGPFELTVGQVTTVEDGRLVRIDQYDAEDREAMLARYRELGGTSSFVVGDSSAERLTAELQRLLNTRDYDGLAELVADDWYFVDHRALAWDDGHGREQCLAIMRSTFDASPDLRVDYDEVLASDDRVVVTRTAWRGQGVKAGDLEVAVGAVHLFENDRWVGIDFYEPEDRQAMIARYVELGGGAGPLGDKPPERFWKRYLPLLAARDIDAMDELYAEEFTFVDRRRLGWESFQGGAGGRSLTRSALDATTDFRIEVDEVLACDDRVLAARMRYCGRAVDEAGGGEFEVSVGFVSVIESGQWLVYEQYDSDDREAMLARYRELSADEPQALRLSREFIAAWNARDLDRVIDLYTEDAEVLDHRPFGGEPGHGREAIREIHRTAWELMNTRERLDEVIGCNDRVAAMLVTFSGSSADSAGAEGEIPVGAVVACADGKLVSSELFDPDDRVAIVGRYVELGGGLGKLGGTRPERWLAEHARRYAARDLAGMLALMSDDWVQVDHRKMGWTEMDKDRAAVEFQSTWDGARDIRLEIDEVIAANEVAFAGILTYRGSATDDHGGGAFEYSIGRVSTHEGDRCTRAEWFDPNDRGAMLSRYAELSVSGGTAERLVTEYLRLIEARDLDQIRATLADEIEVADHRAVAAPPGRGPEAALELMSSALGITDKLRFEIEEVLDSSDRTVALRGTWIGTASEGHGELVLSMALVVATDGERMVSLDLFEHDDVDDLRSRFADVSEDRPPELGDRPIELLIAEQLRRFNSHDVELALEGLAEEIDYRDHRTISTGDRHGRDEMRETLRSVFEVGPDVRRELEVIACDEHVIAARMRYRGSAGSDGIAEYEVVNSEVWAERDGEMVSGDLYDPEDRKSAIARYAELGGGVSLLGDRPPERQVKEYARRLAARDLDGLAELHAPDWVLIDHRRLGWEEVRGIDGALAIIRSGFDLLVDVRLEVDEVLAVDDRVIALLVNWRGTASETGGEMAIPLGLVIVVESGRAVRHEQYEAEDRDAILARYEELRAART